MKNIPMKNLFYKLLVLESVALLGVLSSFNTFAAPGNGVYINTAFYGEIPPTGHLQFCLQDTFRIKLTNISGSNLPKK